MRNTPAYGIAEAARYLRIAQATLRSWVPGRSYPKSNGDACFCPLIRLPDKEARFLSFNNLIEAYVLQSLRHEHGVSIQAVRNALDYAQSKLNVPHLLISPDLSTNAGDLFLQRYGELTNLSLSGQLAMRKLLENHLRRIDWEEKLLSRLYPFLGTDDKKWIAIDPAIQFGRPMIARKGISTEIIVNRFDAGESLEAISQDYDLTQAEVELAIMYEHAA